MASKGRVDVTVRGGGFDVGEKVGLSTKYGDNYLPGQGQLKTATINRYGEVTFKDVDPGRYWVHRLEAPHRAITVHAKHRQDPASKPDRETVQRRLDATRPVTGQGEIVTGAVNTSHVQVGRQGTEFAHSRLAAGLRAPGDLRTDLDGDERERAIEQFDPAEMVRGTPVGHPTPKGELPVEATPALAQEDARGVPQRSATVTGTAHPVDPDEPVPAPRQDQVPKNQPQRSATELGTAAPVPEGEASPKVRQEDARGIPQRSATPTGEAAALPATREPETTRVRESSQAKAEGGEPQQPGKPAVREEKPARVRSTGNRRKPTGTKKEARQIKRGTDPVKTGSKSRAKGKQTRRKGERQK